MRGRRKGSDPPPEYPQKGSNMIKRMVICPKARKSLSAFMAAVFFICFCLYTFTGISYAGDRATRVIDFLSSGTRTAATAYSSSFDISAYIEGLILVNVTAEDGACTLDITIQSSDNNSTWYTHTTMTQITATGSYLRTVTNIGKYLRIKYVIGGSTSFTFKVAGVFKT